MAKLSNILRSSNDNGLNFMCPGCGEVHHVQYGEGTGPRWKWNGSVEKPTFAPSILVTTGHYCNPGDVVGNCACDFQQRYPDQSPWPWPCSRCHSYITDGRIQFLGDCTHKLAGQTVDLPPWTEKEVPAVRVVNTLNGL